MPITTQDGLLAAIAAGERKNLNKASATTEGAGTWFSLWKIAGNPPAGANPPAYTAGSGYSPTDATTGAIPFTNPTNDAYLARLSMSGATLGTVILYDRLWACSSFLTNTTSTQTVTTPGSLPSGRDPNTGLDVEPWIEVYTAPGATGATWTMTGTDADGNTGRTWTYAHPANAETAGQMAPMQIGTASKLGCRAVASLACSISSGTAGDVGVTLLRRLAEIPINVINVGQVLDAYALGLPDVYDDAAIAMMVQCTATNTGQLLGLLTIAKD